MLGIIKKYIQPFLKADSFDNFNKPFLHERVGFWELAVSKSYLEKWFFFKRR